MALSPYVTTLASGARADSTTETYDVASRGRRGVIVTSDVSLIGNGNSFVTGAAVTLPYVSSAAANTSFKFNTVEYTIPAGTYTTLAQLAAAVNGALNVATRFDTVVTVSVDGTGLRFTNVATGVHAEAFAVGTTHDALVTLGITAGWLINRTQAAGADGAFSQTITIQGKDEASGKYYDILASAVQTSISTRVLQAAPDLVAVTNLVIAALLPATIRVSITHTTANSITRTIGLQLVS